MKYLGIKPFMYYSDESLLIHVDGFKKHTLIFEYDTKPKPCVRYIYIEQPGTGYADRPGWFHVFELTENNSSDSLEEIFEKAKELSEALVRYQDSILKLNEHPRVNYLSFNPMILS